MPGRRDFLGDEPGERASPLVLLPFLVFALLLGWLYASEGLLRIPVPLAPAPHEEIAARSIHLLWNPVAGDGVVYDVQIARDGPGFQDLLFEAYDLPETRTARVVVPQGETHYWRVRSKSGGRTHRWSAPVPFRLR